IENSIKHSGGERIRITGREEEDTVRISVEDDGRGIPDDMKEEVFERSFSGVTSRGTGMGTYLVKMIAQTSGGDVTVKDSELGGARFEITLKKV
ncbi:histidine kinase, partial [candidate division MSBL1 archaeon SCGC-AAA259A05]